jgi:hypothetical protein
MKELLAIQQEIGVIAKDKTNPFYKSNYFDINSLLEVIKPVLNKHGVTVMQPLTHLEGKPAIATIFTNEAGESLEYVTPLPDIADPQKAGGAITYYRRYALQSFLSLEADDDDGNAASGKTSAPVQSQQKAIADQMPGGDMCQNCGAILVEKSGTKNGKAWRGLFCPDASKEDRANHTVKWL